MTNAGAWVARTTAIALGWAVVFGGGPARAQTAASTLNLTVSPVVVEFHAGAGDTGTTTITVRNSGTSPERVIAQRMDWRVGADGNVKVEQPGAEGAASIADYLRIEPTDVPLAPGESREFALTLDLPANFPTTIAAYHAGFLLRAVPPTGKANFTPAATVVVYNTVGSPRMHVNVTQLHVSAPAGGTALVSARIVNDGAAYARSTARIVLRRDGQVVVDQTEGVAVLFAGEARVYTKTFHDLAPGAYDISFTLDYGGPTLIEGTTQVHVR
jgi:hypothetical protein